MSDDKMREAFVTSEMVDAYLKANDEYWKQTDTMPRNPIRWRNGNVKEATAVSLAAALATQARPVDAPTDAERLREIAGAWKRHQEAERDLCCNEPTDAEERAAALHRTAFAILMHTTSEAVAAMRATPADGGEG